MRVKLWRLLLVNFVGVLALFAVVIAVLNLIGFSEHWMIALANLLIVFLLSIWAIDGVLKALRKAKEARMNDEQE